MELLHLVKSPSCLRDSTTQASQSLHRGLPDAPPVCLTPNLSSKTKWGKQQMGDDVRLSDGLSLSSSLDSGNYPILSNTHAVGSTFGQNYCRIGRDIYRLGHDLHALPPRKLRKLLTTFSDGVRVFSCVKRVGVSNFSVFEWSNDGFDPVQSFLSRKRSWQFCAMNWSGHESADALSGFSGLSSIYKRLTNVDIPHDDTDFHIQNLGSGGNSNGGGQWPGGNGEGHNNFGPEQPGSNIHVMPVSTGWHDEQDNGSRLDKAVIDGMVIPPGDTSNTSMQNCSILNEDIAMASDEKDVPDSCDIENLPEESSCMVNGLHQFLNKMLEPLQRTLSLFHSEFQNILNREQPTMVGENSNHIRMWQYDAHHPFDETPEDSDHAEVQGDFQEMDMPLMDDNFPAEFNRDLLEKLRGLTLGSVKHLLPHAENMQTENPIHVEQGPKHNVESGGNARREEQLPAGGRLQGVMDSFDHLAHSASARHGEHQERIEKENQVEDQELRFLINEAVVSALKQLNDTGGTPALAKQGDMETLRRLQREVFLELLKLREKLDQIALTRGSNSGRNLSGAGKTTLKGEVKVGTAVVILEDGSSRHSRGSLEQAGMQTGVDVRLTFETPFREKDLLITECIAGQGSTVGEGRSLGGPMSLGKVHYVAHMNDDITISFVPIGAQGMDVTDIVNPMQGQGLTAFSSCGPGHFGHCKDSAIGATWSGSSFAVSAAQFLSGWGNQGFSLGTDTRESGPLCLSTLGQLLLQPTECLIFSLSGLNRFWPSPPLPSSTGLHWSEMGPLVIPKIQSLQTSRSTFSSVDSFLSHCNSSSSHWGMLDSEYHLDAPESKGTSQLSVAVASEMEIVKDLSLGAWAQVEMGDVLQDLDKGNFQWSVNIAKTSQNGVDWGASIGSSKPDVWSTSTSDQAMYPGYVGGVGDSYGSQLHLEAFLKLSCGKGFTLQPGLLYLLNKHAHTPAFIVRSSWFF